MSNFSPKLEEATEIELRNWISESPGDLASLASEELTRRKSDEFNKNAVYFSKILGLFALVQIIMAIMQFVLSAHTSYKNQWQVLLVIIILFALLYFTFYKPLKTISKK